MLQPAAVMCSTGMRLCAYPASLSAAQLRSPAPCSRRAVPSVRAASQDDGGAGSNTEQASGPSARRGSGFIRPDDASPQPMRVRAKCHNTLYAEKWWCFTIHLGYKLRLQVVCGEGSCLVSPGLQHAVPGLAGKL